MVHPNFFQNLSFHAVTLATVLPLSQGCLCSSQEEVPSPPEMTAAATPPPPGSGYREQVGRHSDRLGVEYLDGNPGFLEEEWLAEAYVLDRFEGITDSEVEKWQPLLRSKVRDAYEALRNLRPDRQAVYLDLSDLEPFYRQKFQPVLGQDFSAWKSVLIREIETFFRPSSGEKLGITFFSEPPRGQVYTTVAVTPKMFRQFMYEDDSRKARLPALYLHKENSQVSRVKSIVARVAQTLPSDMPEEEKMIRVADDPEFKSLVTEAGVGHFVNTRSLEFGNPTKNDLVWIGAERLYRNYELARMMIDEGKTYPFFTSYAPWIAEGKGHITEALAETTAHEVGHALGLKHPGSSLIPLRRKAAPTPNRRAHLMDVNDLRDSLRPEVLRFSDFAFDYLKFILIVYPEGRPKP